MKNIFWMLMVIMVVITANAEESIYGLKSVWKDHNGQNKTLKDFSGSPTLITMVYTACAHTCPMTISKLETIKKEIAKAGIKNVKVVLASFDEKTDTPENLKKYMGQRKMNESEWVFLSPSSQSLVRELSVVLGISYKKLGDGDFSHSNVITLLDKKGVPIAKIDNLSADTKVFTEVLSKIK